MSLIWVFLTLAVSAASAELMNEAQKQDMLNTHNLFRAQTARGEIRNQPRASNMMLMEWNEELARSANTLAGRCAYAHDRADDRKMEGFSFVGQNWAAYSYKNFSAHAIEWFNEYKDYSYNSKWCRSVCGHYTALVWAKTVMVGCAFGRCSRYPFFVVCNYAPGGNMYGELPYKNGKPCSQCEGENVYCMGGLCATKSQCERSGVRCSGCTLTASSCQNGGTLDSEKCACNCPSDFYGTRCESKCANENKWEYTCTNTVARDMRMCKKFYGKPCVKTCGLCKIDATAKQGRYIPKVLGS